MAKLIFFDADHSYQVDGETVPSVSEILRFMSREIYDSVTQWRLDNAADRGSRIHKACENIDRYGSCEIASDIEPYIRAYIRFLQEHKPEWKRIEHAMYSPTKGYAGTLDRYGIIGGKRTIVDIKSNSAVKAQLVAAQLAGYGWLACENDLPVDQVAYLHLRNTGEYCFKIVEAATDAFQSCLTLHNALKKKTRRKGETNGTKPDSDTAAG